MSSIFTDGVTPLNKATLDQLEVAARKGQANGYASLDATTKIPAAQLPSGVFVPVSSVAAANGVASLDAGTKVPVAQLPAGTASGVASLDSGTKVPVAQIPDLSATYQALTGKAAANGYASLDGTGKVPSAQLPAAAGPVTYRKTTVKTVNTSVATTDLLNGEITVAANALPATGILRFKAWGDWLHNGGANSAPPRFQLVLGGTTIFDTGTSGGITATTNRATWVLNAIIQAVNATNSQESVMDLLISGINGTTGTVANTFTTPSTSGLLVSQNFSTNFTTIVGQGSNASALDMTTSKTLVLNVILATSSVTEEIKLFGALVEVI